LHAAAIRAVSVKEAALLGKTIKHLAFILNTMPVYVKFILPREIVTMSENRSAGLQ
jgi:hypothetical protein